ncbi:hypothetical protein EB796_017223 [Bugula neritina]|uniref:Uncharacterized protein n=1 Tax=Bugula neritina TaxID=10212 RepID=A0A7J7JEC5_BUGNE|nr:hypothetical protein EB796_017223 [Bugula neritina]
MHQLSVVLCVVVIAIASASYYPQQAPAYHPYPRQHPVPTPGHTVSKYILSTFQKFQLASALFLFKFGVKLLLAKSLGFYYLLTANICIIAKNLWQCTV